MEAVINECLFFRRGFHELLVEPESASQEFQNRWQFHRSQCERCNLLFEKAQREQNQIHELLLQLPEYIALSNGVGFIRSIENSRTHANYNTKKKNGRSRRFWIAIAASVLLLAVSVGGWLSTTSLIPTKPQMDDAVPSMTQARQIDLDRPGEIDSYHKNHELCLNDGCSHLGCEEMHRTIAQRIARQMEKISANAGIANAQNGLALNVDVKTKKAMVDYGEIERITEEIVHHIEQTHAELVALGKLSAEFPSSLSGSELLSQRLKLQCRLALTTPDSFGKLGSPNNDPAQAIEKFIQNQVPTLGLDERGREVATCFFHRASPHLLSILNGRNSLIDEIGDNTVRNLGGESETLMLILSLEDINCLKY